MNSLGVSKTPTPYEGLLGMSLYKKFTRAELIEALEARDLADYTYGTPSERLEALQWVLTYIRADDKQEALITLERVIQDMVRAK
jgi:predicted 2-oxoglutarate/Fe(II)-dependent dioxygenase YbiX